LEFEKRIKRADPLHCAAQPHVDSARGHLAQSPPRQFPSPLRFSTPACATHPVTCAHVHRHPYPLCYRSCSLFEHLHSHPARSPPLTALLCPVLHHRASRPLGHSSREPMLPPTKCSNREASRLQHAHVSSVSPTFLRHAHHVIDQELWSPSGPSDATLSSVVASRWPLIPPSTPTPA
jgi:hypothetical protein